MSLVFFDFETGGLNPESPDIQLAAIAVDSNWTEIDTFERKIQFDVTKADTKALEMNHFDADVWKQHAKPESVVAEDFSAFLGRHKSIEMVSKRTGNPYSVARLAGHNALTFDGPRLKAMFERYRMFLPAHPLVLCTLQRAMWWFLENGKSVESLKLASLCDFFGTKLPDAHDALADVRGSIIIAKAMAVSVEVAV